MSPSLNSPLENVRHAVGVVPVPELSHRPISADDARPTYLNLASRLRTFAEKQPDAPATIQPVRRLAGGTYRYAAWTYRELDQESDRLARGLVEMGVVPGLRLVLFVPFGREFIALTFALLKLGAVVVLIDPGMGPKQVFECLQEVDPDGFVAIPLVHAARIAKRRLFPRATFNVTVGRRWLWGGRTYRQLRRWGTETLGEPFEIAATKPTDPAAIIFTSGSTGPPKGVLYEHGMFDAQVEMIRDFYGIQPGDVDLAGFPLFGLFDACMGVTTVIPDMNPTRPADVDSERIVQQIRDHRVTQAFGSPAFWNRVGRYCDERDLVLPTLKRALSAGAPVPHRVLERMSRLLTGDGADLFTPYGATESLPVASIGARDVLNGTAERTRAGAGTCVGSPFPGVDVRIVEITEQPIESIEDCRELPAGEIGEIVVRSRSVTREYFRRRQATRLAKIPDGKTFWHRMGDVGYLDEAGRLWMCGRKAHIVETPQGRMFTVCCEAIFNEHPDVYRSALVGVGEQPRQTPVIVVEPERGRYPQSAAEITKFRVELRQRATGNSLTASIETILFHHSLPVDTRHNVKINREQLADWAARNLRSLPGDRG